MNTATGAGGTGQTLGIGVVGCGNISTAYMRHAAAFRGVEIRACADLNQTLAQARAEEFGVDARRVEVLLTSPDIDIVLNLTIPAAHYSVSRSALEAGKHVYSEKPFALTIEDARDLAQLARSRGLRVGSAPDTFLGGAHQYARRLIDEGGLGDIVGGTAHIMSHGAEAWHPSPDFFYKPGGGPVLDMGPYYLTNLVQLIGPAKRVTAMGAAPLSERVIGSGARAGERIAVETLTTLHAVITFETGAIVTMGASWDVWSHGHPHMELYGTAGTLALPDPNFFSGDVTLTHEDGSVTTGPDWDHPLGVANRKTGNGPVADYRMAGLADMARAIGDDGPQRCSLELATHVVEIMTAIHTAAEDGGVIDLTTSCERPPLLDPETAAALMV